MGLKFKHQDAQAEHVLVSSHENLVGISLLSDRRASRGFSR